MIVTDSVTQVKARKAVLEMPEYHPPLAARMRCGWTSTRTRLRLRRG